MADTSKYLLGEFDLDPASYSLVRGSTVVPISRKRFQVLLHLIEQRHRVVMRQELVERFWEGHEVYEENLTKCISEVRKALDDQQKPHRFIETIPAVGYRYIGPVEERIVRVGGPIRDEADTGPPAVAAEEPWIDESESPYHPEKIVPAPAPAIWRMRASALVLLLAVLTLGAALIYPYRTNSRASADDPAAIHSLAILPFKPISELNRDEFLELGMADALITKLSNIRQVAAVSYTH